MTTFKRYRIEKRWQRSHTPERSVDVETDYNYKLNRYQKAHWGDIEAKEAHASVVKYMWRKEYELNKEIDKLKKQISKQIETKQSGNGDDERQNPEVFPEKTVQRGFTKREMEAPMRGVHFRTTEDKTMEKLNLFKSERKLVDNELYIAKIRSKAKASEDVDDDLSENLKCLIRGKSAYQISAALLADTDRSARMEARRRELEYLRNQQQTRDIYDIMADRNKLGITARDDHEPHHPNERKPHSDHDYRWNNRDYLNLVGYRMQNDRHRWQNERPAGFSMQNHGEIIW